jgi:hypothetical protein
MNTFHIYQRIIDLEKEKRKIQFTIADHKKKPPPLFLLSPLLFIYSNSSLIYLPNVGSNPDLCWYTILALTPLLSFLGYDPAILFLFN